MGDVTTIEVRVQHMCKNAVWNIGTKYHIIVMRQKLQKSLPRIYTLYYSPKYYYENIARNKTHLDTKASDFWTLDQRFDGEAFYFEGYQKHHLLLITLTPQLGWLSVPNLLETLTV